MSSWNAFPRRRHAAHMSPVDYIKTRKHDAYTEGKALKKHLKELRAKEMEIHNSCSPPSNREEHYPKSIFIKKEQE